MSSRREFLQSSAVLLAAGCAHALRSPESTTTSGRLPIGFSTLGAPEWSWTQVLDFAVAHGYAAIELRGIQKEMDLTLVPELAPARLPDAKRQLAERGLRVICLGASANMHEIDAAKRAAAMAEGRRFIDLARALGAPYVRVFGNEYLPGVPRDAMLAHIAAALRELGGYAGDRGVTVLIESHGAFTDSPSLRELLERADSPSVALLWDAHHTFAQSHESPEETVRQLGRWIRHTHLKDSVPTTGDRRYVLTGSGDVPVRRQVAALVRSGYTGYYSFEWEKRWHPEIEAPEVAIAQFATVVGGYLRDAGGRAG
jgi:sugar phosphate isomerase/epimerase